MNRRYQILKSEISLEKTKMWNFSIDLAATEKVDLKDYIVLVVDSIATLTLLLIVQNTNKLLFISI